MFEKLPPGERCGFRRWAGGKDFTQRAIRAAHYAVTHPEKTSQKEAQNRTEQPYLERSVEDRRRPGQPRVVPAEMSPGEVIRKDEKIKDHRCPAQPFPPGAAGQQALGKALYSSEPKELTRRKQRNYAQKGAQPRHSL